MTKVYWVVTNCLGVGDSSLLERCVAVGAFSGAVIGGIVGLGVGLAVYAPTAVVAVFEVGVPASIVGGLIGVIVALILTVAHRNKGSVPPSD